MATHGPHPDADAVHRDGLGAAQNLVGLVEALPLFAGFAAFHLFVDPGDQAGRQGGSKILRGKSVGLQRRTNTRIDCQGRAGWVAQQGRGGIADGFHLGHEFAHIARTRSGSRLVGHGREPLHPALFEQTVECHQHQGHGAIAPRIGEHAALDALVDDCAIHRVQHNDGVFVHALGPGGIDPIALPARLAQLGQHLLGVITALAAHHRIVARQLADIVSVGQGRGADPHVRGRVAHLGGGEENGLQPRKVAFGHHALHQDGSHHPAPTHKCDSTNLHSARLISKINGIEQFRSGSGALSEPIRSGAGGSAQDLAQRG